MKIIRHTFSGYDQFVYLLRIISNEMNFKITIIKIDNEIDKFLQKLKFTVIVINSNNTDKSLHQSTCTNFYIILSLIIYTFFIIEFVYKVTQDI